MVYSNDKQAKQGEVETWIKIEWALVAPLFFKSTTAKQGSSVQPSKVDSTTLTIARLRRQLADNFAG